MLAISTPSRPHSKRDQRRPESASGLGLLARSRRGHGQRSTSSVGADRAGAAAAGDRRAWAWAAAWRGCGSGDGAAGGGGGGWRLQAGRLGRQLRRGGQCFRRLGEIQDLDILAGGGIGQQRDAPAAAVCHHRADGQARRQQAAIAGD